MTRFDEDLIRHIISQDDDVKGEKGKWIKATKHSYWYNFEHPNHNDIKGFDWNREVTDQYKNGNILIFKNPSNHNYFVLPEWGSYFERLNKSCRLKPL